MRLLHISQPTDYGVGHCVRDLVRFGQGAGHEVTVACPSGDLADWARADGAHWVELPMRRSPGPADIMAAARVHRVVEEADVVMLHSSKAGVLGRCNNLVPRARRPCIFVPHGWSWHVGGPAAPVYRMIERLLAREADAIIAVSDDDYAVGRSVLGAGTPLRMIRNGVDTDLFTPDGLVAQRPSGGPLLVCVGRLSAAKGQVDALRALTMLQDTTATLRLVGVGEDDGMLRSLAGELGIAERVQFIGSVADPRPHYRAADMVLVPSRWDAQSRVLLEAMACGSAIIATAVPGSSALADAGVRVPSGDPARLAEAVDELLDRPDRRRELGALARRQAVERFGLAAVASEWRSLWEEAVSWR
jgi:glycosyltransferase involved in cell wall biosynthesis